MAALLYEQPTDLLRISAHFLVDDGLGNFRKYEESGLPSGTDSLAYVTANRTPQQMWDAGTPVSGNELLKLQLLRDANAAANAIDNKSRG